VDEDAFLPDEKGRMIVEIDINTKSPRNKSVMNLFLEISTL